MNKYLGISLVGALVVALDQWTKLLVLDAIPLWGRIPVIEGFFNLVHVRNRGAAFGFLNRSDTDWQFWFFAAATLVAVLVILYLARTQKSGRLFYFALGLLLGGAAGNFIDRVRFRHVIDFLDFYYADWHWPAFNVADISITCGVVIIGASMLFGAKKS